MATSAAALSIGGAQDSSFGRVVWGVHMMGEGHDPGPARQVVAVVILLILLVGGGLWLVRSLRNTAAIQDCVAAGRSNCAPIRTGS